MMKNENALNKNEQAVQEWMDNETQDDFNAQLGNQWKVYQVQKRASLGYMTDDNVNLEWSVRFFRHYMQNLSQRDLNSVENFRIKKFLELQRLEYDQWFTAQLRDLFGGKTHNHFDVNGEGVDFDEDWDKLLSIIQVLFEEQVFHMQEWMSHYRWNNFNEKVEKEWTIYQIEKSSARGYQTDLFIFMEWTQQLCDYHQKQSVLSQWYSETDFRMTEYLSTKQMEWRGQFTSQLGVDFRRQMFNQDFDLDLIKMRKIVRVALEDDMKEQIAQIAYSLDDDDVE